MKAAPVIRIEIPGEPIAKARPRFGNGHAYTPKRTADYEEAAGWHAKKAMSGELPYDAPIWLKATFIFVPPKSWSKKKRTAALSGEMLCDRGPDLDNLTKALADSLNGIVYVDDKQIFHAEIGKHYGPTAGTIVEVRPIIGRAAA